MDSFNTIRLKKKTIDKFKKHSKKVSPSYSETLDFMIAFFEDNNISPYDTLRTSNTSFLNEFNKRMDAVVAIFRNVEETQLKPTKQMLESLFKEMEVIQTTTAEENENVLRKPSLISENEELTYYRDAYFKRDAEINELKEKVNDLLEKSEFIKNTFSSNRYVLKMSELEFEEMKNSML